MCSDGQSLALSARGVGKCYSIYDKPQDRLKQSFWRGRKQFFHPFWALRDVSFDLPKGGSMGIVGRNGSGKSTLLQMIAGTVTPTEGEILVSGRIAALLELGSGFNMEFTGRENVFLNGSIVGIPRSDMEKRFDEIAAFADIGEYLDQPVRTYSSGMFARLAFAVAVCIDPDILVVDEILSVGDMAFQQKCVARLKQMRENGLTLLFVSHSPDTVKSICAQGLFLKNGKTEFWGSAERAVDLYYTYTREQANVDALAVQKDLSQAQTEKKALQHNRYGTRHVTIEEVDLLDESGEPCRAFAFGATITLTVRLRAHIEARNLSVSFLVRDMAGIDLMGTTTLDERVDIPDLAAGETTTVSFRFANVLRAGNYGVCVAVNRVRERDGSDNVLFEQVDAAVAFAVIQDPNRPVHYKFHNPVTISCEGPSSAEVI